MRSTIFTSLAALGLLAACEATPPASPIPAAPAEALPADCPNAAACEVASLLADDMWFHRDEMEYDGVTVERIEAIGPVLYIESRFPFSSSDIAQANKAFIERIGIEDMRSVFCDGSPESEAFFALGAQVRIRYVTRNRVAFFDHLIEAC
ncbi:hypothetical protein [Pseudoroseicyclus tamaricis]|uniref:Lipoprotein n=1 Tax=Pseudoroseicyclus tamaricis TaxID=2705421 RepID=A0A6B2JTB6_9RHOB|nr:hypothetical protein [Pseudoroseicyclus tamaricis]NDU99413.1 hypothetical protein [Pseudoroseicyclus tamaricis]